MESVFEVTIRSWAFEPWLIVSLLVTAGVYLRGWWQVHCQTPSRFNVWQLGAFQGGLITIFLALASPLDAFASLLLFVHMVQHILLMIVVPPLLLFGVPTVPLLRGLPSWALKSWLGPFLTWSVVQRLGRFLSEPTVGLVSFLVATLAWHVPALYELALRSDFWHHVEHLSFLGTGLLFWWPVIQPWPSRPRWPRWAMIPYLLLADIQMTALSAFLCFADRVIYPTYVTVPRLWGISALNDQVAAGAIMWVPGSVVLLIAVCWLIIQLLESPQVDQVEVTRVK